MLENPGCRFTASRKITTRTITKRLDMSTRMGVRIQVDPSCCWGIDKGKIFDVFSLIDEMSFDLNYWNWTFRRIDVPVI